MSGIRLPKIFQRLINQQNETAKGLIGLREKKQHRIDQQCVVVQGIKTLRELNASGIKFKSVIVTAKKVIENESDIKSPAIDIINKPEILPAEKYFLTDINLTRRILGTSSRPHQHEVYAVARIPKAPEKLVDDKLLVVDRISDPGNLGTLIRTAKALGWNSGIVTDGTCDLFNDKSVRASRGLALSWAHQTIAQTKVLNFLKENGYTPIVADMLPSKIQDVWSPEGYEKPQVGNGLWFWNFNEQNKELPKKVALILSSEHKGVEKEIFKNEIRVSLPMNSTVESLNVANAGAMIMADLNRYLLNASPPYLK